jgi:putative hydrolase of the HAD superfamily
MEMKRRQFALSIAATSSWGTSLFGSTVSPLGVSRGVVPDRITLAHDPATVTWGGTGSWWTDASKNQSAVDRMDSQYVRSLTNQKSDAQAWSVVSHLAATEAREPDLASARFLSRVTAVSFDLDNTLVDEDFSVQSRWRTTLQEFSHLAPYSQMETEFLRIYSIRGRGYKYHINDLLANIGIGSEWVRPMVDRFLQVRSDESPLEGACALLRYLQSSGYKVAIITNGKQQLQEGRIHAARFDQYLNYVVYGDSFQKPHPDGFRRVLREFNLSSPDRLLHVGDNFEQDVIGCRSIGANACWLRASGEKSKPQDGILVIASLTALLSHFKNAARLQPLGEL